MKTLLVSILGSLLLFSAQAQVTRYVTTTGTTTVPASATTWASSTTNLQGAIDASHPGDQVWVATGVYKPTTTTGSASRTISFAMKNGVSILGGFAGNEPLLTNRILTNPSTTTLSGEIGGPTSTTDNSYHVISNPAGLTTTAVLDGFVITGGNANGFSPDNLGGGMHNNGNGAGQVCSPLIRNCTFQNNTASNTGGAMCNSGFSSGNSSPSLTNCSFQNNTAPFGGAMFNDGVFSGNSHPSLTNCSFGGNTASTSGGAMFNDGRSSGNSSPSLTNCTFEGNTATSGGAMVNDGRNSGISNPGLTNCVLWGNNGVNTFSNQNATVTATHSLFDDMVTGYSANPTNLTTTSSPFASTTSLALAPGSPAIDTGLSSASGLVGITTDLAGNARIVGCRVDMGAVEEQIFTKVLTVVITLPNGSTVSVAGNLSTITLPPIGPLVLQASGGSSYERVIILDRINGFEIRQVDQNTTGLFPINRLGLFSLTVTGVGGCKRTIQAVLQGQ